MLRFAAVRVLRGAGHGVSVERVWNAVESRLPELKQHVEALLASGE